MVPRAFCVRLSRLRTTPSGVWIRRGERSKVLRGLLRSAHRPSLCEVLEANHLCELHVVQPLPFFEMSFYIRDNVRIVTGWERMITTARITSFQMHQLAYGALMKLWATTIASIYERFSCSSLNGDLSTKLVYDDRNWISLKNDTNHRFRNTFTTLGRDSGSAEVEVNLS